MDPVGEEQRLHGDTAGGQPGAGPERVSAVVAGADEQQHAAAVGRAEQVEHSGGETGGGPLHQGAVGQVRHRGGLRTADVLDEVGAQHVRTPG